ncbi:MULTISPECIES: proton-conducting transporter transmembrane domain-containing protein [unclassified Sphingomonas]|uniref:proton-conducting transporter transmembrane domain-containing protein n=1 Tax=unclassified Sphingomonas TaxID=196159 RepID=UPI000833D6CA|nr:MULTISPECIES: proton-conducting transporter membrane subunit [unclassified Sphingomonas]
MNATLSVVPLALLAAMLCACMPQVRAIAMAARLAWALFGAAVALTLAAATGWTQADPLALIAMLLTGFVGAIVLSFARRYLRADADPKRFAVAALLLVAAVMLFVVADALWLIALGWIASGWLMAALVGHVATWTEARAARRRMIATFIVGDVALVGAFAILAAETGSLSTSALGTITDTPATLAALLLVLAAAVRCALFPFHRWLARSMTAPTPASALMHAGFVNAGGLLLIRFAPVLEAAPAARALVIGMGIVAALIGSAMMLVRPDVKRALAGSTSAQMGFMLMTCGLGAYAAALWHIVAHGLFKAWLFLRSGSAIGISEQAVPMRLAPAAVAAIGALAIAATSVLGQLAGAMPSAVPLILAAAMALATLIHLRRHAVLSLIAAVLAATYAAGLQLFAQVLADPDGPALGGPLLPVAIVAVFMTAWLVQTLILDRRMPIPAALYARLLNA